VGAMDAASDGSYGIALAQLALTAAALGRLHLTAHVSAATPEPSSRAAPSRSRTAAINDSMGRSLRPAT
ncbi:transporter, partial [Streptomyces tendae]